MALTAQVAQLRESKEIACPSGHAFLLLAIKVTTILLSERGRYSARRKIPAMDSTKRTAIAGIFASGDRCPAITTKLLLHDFILLVDRLYMYRLHNQVEELLAKTELR